MTALLGLPLALALGIVADLGTGIARTLTRRGRLMGPLDAFADAVRVARSEIGVGFLEAAGAVAALGGSGLAAAAAIGVLPGSLPAVAGALAVAGAGLWLARSDAPAFPQETTTPKGPGKGSRITAGDDKPLGTPEGPKRRGANSDIAAPENLRERVETSSEEELRRDFRDAKRKGQVGTIRFTDVAIGAGARLGEAVAFQLALLVALFGAFLRWRAPGFEGIRGAQGVLGPGLTVGPVAGAAALALAALALAAAAGGAAGDPPGAMSGSPVSVASVPSLPVVVARWAVLGTAALIAAAVAFGPEVTWGSNAAGAATTTTTGVAEWAAAAAAAALLAGVTAAVHGALRPGMRRIALAVGVWILAAGAVVLGAI